MKLSLVAVCATWMAAMLPAAAWGQMSYPVMPAGGPYFAQSMEEDQIVLHAGGFQPGMEAAYGVVPVGFIGHRGCDTCGDCGHCGSGDHCHGCGGCSTCGEGCAEDCGNCGGNRACKGCGKWGCGLFGDPYRGCNAKWRVRGEFIWMDRDIGRTDIVYGTAGATGAPILSSDDFDFDPEPGARMAVERKCGCDSIEMVGFFVQDFHSRQTILAVPGVFRLFAPLANISGPANVAGFDNADAYTVTYESALYNTEFNYWKPFEFSVGKLQGAWLASGFRYAYMPEEFNFYSDALGAFGVYETDTYNNLIGYQQGFWAVYPVTCNLSVSAEGKAGIYANVMRQRTNIAVFGPNVVDLRYTEAETNTDAAFIGEINVLATYRVNCNVSIYGGYQALWMSGLALAHEQFNTAFPNINGRTVVLNDEGSVFFNGLRFGVEVLY